MAKTLKISMETGRVTVPNVPGDDATVEEKDQAATKIMEEVKAALDGLEARVESEAREVLKELWILHSYLEAHPAGWVKNFAVRRDRNEVVTRIDAIKSRCMDELPEGVGKAVWENLPYIRDSLGLLFDKLRASGGVQRMILTPLGNLKYAQIKYQRDSPEDLTRVCSEMTEHVRRTLDLDDKVKTWGPANREALLYGREPTEIPADLVASSGPGVGAIVVGLALLGAGGAALAGAIPGGVAAGAGGIVLGLVAAGLGAKLFGDAKKLNAQVPKDFAELSAQFRERLYVVCALRNLFLASSQYQVAADAYDTFLKGNGGRRRWQQVKNEDRDLTELFATDSWHEKGTIETWLKEQVTQVFRLESQTLAAPDKLDDETWDIIMKAYQLESVEDTADDAGKLLAAVGDLLFTKRGEDTKAERKRVFSQVRQAWEQAASAGHDLG